MLTVSHNENSSAPGIRAVAQEGQDLIAAGRKCAEIRQALDDILAHATDGAHDLRAGLPRSRHLEKFETLSMEQARALAKFPIGTVDTRFGALVHRARASFVAFRETVRREIIGGVDTRTDNAAYELALDHVTNRSTLAAESLKSVELALSQG